MIDENAKQTVSKAVGGIAPFGYRWQNGSLMVDREESSIRQLIYELFIKHKRKKTVAKLLNDLGYRTRNGSLFSDTTIDRLIRDTTAKGIRIELGKEIKVEPIVSVEIWERANNFLGEKQTKQPLHLFTDFSFCQCGGKMIVPGNTDKYVCLNCRHKLGCADLEEIFLSQIQEFPIPNQNETFGDYWEFLSSKEKRILIDQILNKIIIDKKEIHFEFGFRPNSFKAANFSQHNERGNESPKTAATEATKSIQNEPLMNEQEAAKFLGVSKMTLLRKRNAEEIGFYRVGFRVLYSKEKHLIPFLESCEK